MRTAATTMCGRAGHGQKSPNGPRAGQGRSEDRTLAAWCLQTRSRPPIDDFFDKNQRYLDDFEVLLCSAGWFSFLCIPAIRLTPMQSALGSFFIFRLRAARDQPYVNA